MHPAHSEFIRKYSILSYRHTWFKILSVNFFHLFWMSFFLNENHLQTDLIFIKKENMGIFQEQGWIHGVPNLLIEIRSKGTFTRDTKEIFENYQRYGVSEYWLVFPELHCIEVFALKNALYSLYCSTERTDRKVFSKLLKGMEIDSRLIFG